jgi:cytoskeletal protein CcmA (bactofilin family)
MLNFSRNDRPADPAKDPKLAQRPAAPATPPPMPPVAAPRIPTAAVDVPAAPTPAAASDNPGSRLSIGPNINLKGVEISNCDVLAIEGNVEATINSKVMEIAPPGRLNGTATIDVAEIHGEFTGELTVREKLVVHGTGRVTGTIRYGKLVVDEGGIINGELKQLEPGMRTTAASSATTHAGNAPAAPRTPLSPQPH